MYVAAVLVASLFCCCVIPGFEQTTTTSTSSTTTRTTTTKATTTSTTSTTSTTTTFAGDVTCTMNSDCGIGGIELLGKYTCNFWTVAQQYKQYRCENPGTIYSKCVGKVVSETLKVCDEDEKCLEGTPYCRAVRGLSSYGDVCSGKTCVLLNGTNATKYRSRKGEYVFTLDYIIASPEGIHLTAQKPTKEKVERFLMAGHDEVVGDLLVRLSYFKMPDNYAMLSINPPAEETPKVTLPKKSCIPSGASRLVGLSYDTYNCTYGEYSFKLKNLYYLDEYSVSSTTLYVKKARNPLTGSKEVISEVTCSPSMDCSIYSLTLGVCWEEAAGGPVVWFKP